jgi:hypothetical protein
MATDKEQYELFEMANSHRFAPSYKRVFVTCSTSTRTKLCRQQAEAIQNHENGNVRNIGQGEPLHRKYKKLKLDGGQAYDRLSD